MSNLIYPLQKEVYLCSSTSFHSDYSMSKNSKDICREIIKDFAAIPKENRKAVKVGIVGEIYVKYTPLGNNNLVDFLNKEGAEVTTPGLLTF